MSDGITDAAKPYWGGRPPTLSEKRMDHALKEARRALEDTLEKERKLNGSIVLHFHEGWFKCYEIKVRKKPQEVHDERPKD